MLEIVLYMTAFIALSGLMAVIEAAVLSVSRAEVEELVIRRAFGAGALKAITTSITRTVVVVVLFTNTINILGPILTGRKAIQVYGDASIAVITVALTIGTIVFSEIIPKSLGTHYAPYLGRLAAPVIQVLIWALYPIVIGLEMLADLFKVGERPIGTEAQIRSLVTIGRRAGYIESDEGQLIRRAFILNDRTAADIMTPLSDVVGVNETHSIRHAASQVFQHAYSRYPVFGSSKDDIKGLVLSRDILQALTEGRGQDSTSSICRPCLIVPAGTRSDELLVRFRDKHQHLAIVQDGAKTVGLVTLEDVLEELVGEIEDEKDAPSKQTSTTMHLQSPEEFDDEENQVDEED